MFHIPDTASLQALIGRTVHYRGQAWRVIEFLEDEGQLVLQAAGRDRVIQADQYGEAHRRVPECLSIPVHGDDGKTLHPDFLELRFTAE